METALPILAPTTSITKYSKNVNAIMERVNDTKIATTESYDAANHLFGSIRLIKKTIKDDFKENIKTANDLHKDLIAQRDEHLKLPKKAEEILKRKLDIYLEIQKKAREAAERKAREEAERLKKEEEDRILLEAEAAKENGASEEHVDLVLNQKVLPPEPTVDVPSVPKHDARVLGKKKWTFRILDVDIIPRDWMIPNEKQLGVYVRTMKEKTDIPGIEVFEENSW